jgi:hypothetical protein
MIKTIQQYANEHRTSQQNVRQSKKIPMIDCPIYAMYGGEYIHIGYQKFVIENKLSDNQQVINK